jgi:exodeoxyribonuclease V gamma subunit
MGDALYEAEEERVNRVARALVPLVRDASRERFPFERDLGAITLTGALANLGTDGMLDYRMSSTNEHLRIRAWIRHLVLNALAPEGIGRTSRCVTQECVLTFSPVADARARLVELTELYWTGQQRPLHFFPRTAWAYVNSSEEDIVSKVRSVWQGSAYDESAARAERDDPYYELAFRGTDPLDEHFKAAARTVFGPMLDHMTERPLP